MSAHSRLRRTAVLLATVLIMGLGSPTFAATTPGVATGLKASTTSSSATLTWKAPTGAKTYGVCLYTSSAATACTTWFGGLTKTSLTVKDLKPTGGKDYFFTVLSYNGSAFSRTAKVGFDLAAPSTTTSVPSQATGLKAVPTTSGATLSWTAAAGATYYGVCLYTSETATSCAKWTGNITKTSLTLTGLKPNDGTDYLFTVLSYNSSGFSRSAKVAFNLVVPGSLPSIPANQKATTTTTGANLTWSASTGAKYYGVCLFKKAADTACSKFIGNIDATSLSLTDLVSQTGPDYLFTVLAYNDQGISRTGKLGFDLKPAVVTGITRTVSTSGVTVTWPKALNAEKYSVCLVTNSTTTTCGRTSTTSTSLTASFNDLKTTPDTDWYYIVHAFNGAETSASPRVAFDLPVAAVTGFDVKSSTTNSIDFVWNAVTNAEKYQLQLATSADMTKGLVTFSPTTAAYEATKLVPGTTYFFRVRGTNGVVLGAWTSVNTLHLSTAPFDAIVLTYNLCGQDKCRTNATSSFRSNVPVWKTRKPVAGDLVGTTRADIIATQESQTADTNFITELPGFTLGAYLSAKSLYYKTSEYDRIRWGTITLSSTRKKYAVWMELRDKATRTRFIVSDTHTTPGKGKTNDDYRYAETKILLDAINKVNTENLPEVYAGDFNSNKSNAKSSGGYDAVDKRMKAAGMLESLEVAAYAWHVKYNSANQGINPPYMYGDHVDHIYVDPRIKVPDSGIVLKLNAEGTAYSKPFPSDHNPLRATLTIPGNP